MVNDHEIEMAAYLFLTKGKPFVSQNINAQKQFFLHCTQIAGEYGVPCMEAVFNDKGKAIFQRNLKTADKNHLKKLLTDREREYIGEVFSSGFPYELEEPADLKIEKIKELNKACMPIISSLKERWQEENRCDPVIKEILARPIPNRRTFKQSAPNAKKFDI